MAILYISRTDFQGYVLLNSELHEMDDTIIDDMDIKVVATDGQFIYTSLIVATRRSSLLARNSPLTEEEFSRALSDILKGKPKTGNLQDMDVVATVIRENIMTLSIRKHTAGITQRVGGITLRHDENEGIELFEWCGDAVVATDVAREEMSLRDSVIDSQKKTIAMLTKQLDDLLVAKKEHEDLLLERVALLLNEKKLKIRDQQRLLSTAKVDENKLADVKATRRPEGRKAHASSSKNKRKKPSSVNDAVESDDAFDKMEVDVEEVANDSEQNDRETPDEDETEDEEEEAPSPPPPPSKGKGRIGGGRTTKESEKEGAKKRAGNSEGSTNTIGYEDDNREVLPPPRQLPFSSAKIAAASVTPPQPQPQPQPQLRDDEAGESTESDDEL